MKPIVVLVLLAALGQVDVHADGDEQTRAFDIEREVVRIAREADLWPGYDPLVIPLAVYTGDHTYLFRHPSPPEGFTVIPGHTAHRLAGRHPRVTSNSSAEIGDVPTATLLADGQSAGRSSTDQAAIALHEAFHVYQRAHHPNWSGNEGDLFLYPVGDGRLLGLRRLESVALDHALNAEAAAASACWVRRALEYRTERFAQMEPAFPEYERRTELNEGLAAYIQLLAADRSTLEIPPEGFPPAAVRDRIYVIGPALAFLLDRLRPGWQADLESNGDQFLDRMLAAAVTGDSGELHEQCGVEADTASTIMRVANADAARVSVRRRERRQVFDDRAGWRVVIEAPPGEPLWPQGFDPLNVEVVDGGLLHTRFLHLGNERGELRLIDETIADVEALTEAAGPHPMFNGIKRAAIAGLAEPEIVNGEDGVRINAPGLTGHFDHARIEVDDTEVRVFIASD